MRCKVTADRPLEVDGGRTVAPGEFVEVNSRDARTEHHLTAGRLTRVPAPNVVAEEASDG